MIIRRIALASLLFALVGFCRAEWKPVAGHIMTRFAEKVGPKNAMPEHPRPQMMRESWLNLNGLWDYSLEPVEFTPVQGLTRAESMTTGRAPASWQGEILVPFAIDAPLSGVGRVLRPNERIWYRRAFTLPPSWTKKLVLLHCEASDWETSVYVNGQRVGRHRGGYDPFTFEISNALKPGENELTICAWDATEQQCQAIGKQIMPENRKGFRYQPTGGIWQTVWVEAVSTTHISRLAVTPDLDKGQVAIEAQMSGAGANGKLEVEAADGRMLPESTPTRVVIKLDSPRPWSPEDPHLYDFTARWVEGGQKIDEVKSYFGLRKVHVAEAADGFRRVHLNNKPFFTLGPLDQGYWPDGILTPPSDEAIKSELEFLKRIGCNMVRVHVTVHPDRWYYWADKLGLVVLQDMVCMPKYGQKVDAPTARQWQGELTAMIDSLYNHPCIIRWVIFNEGWSQHDTARYIDLVRRRDPSRMVMGASGWTDDGGGDIVDLHDYGFYPSIHTQAAAGGRAVGLGEAGGFNCCVPGHNWYPETKPESAMDYVREGGRPTFDSAAGIEAAYALWAEQIRWLNWAGGLNDVVYTQLTDVEHELNGWLTYDRREPKFAEEKIRALHDRIFKPVKYETLLPAGSEWRYSAPEAPKAPAGKKNKSGKKKAGAPAAKPADAPAPWAAPAFDGSGWKTGRAPFGKLGEQGLGPAIATAFEGSIVLRKNIELAAAPRRPVLGVTTLGPCRIYINGRLLRVLQGAPNDADRKAQLCFIPLRTEEAAWLQAGTNTIAIQADSKPNQGRLLIDLCLMNDKEE